MVCLTALAAAVALGPLNPPSGAVAPTNKTLGEVEPRIALSASTTPSDGSFVYVISAPGSYYLTGNVSSPMLGGIKINASNVTVDLGGFTLIGSGAAAGIVSGPVANSGIVIRNGNIQSFGGDGIDLRTNFTFGCEISNVRSEANFGWGIKVGNGARIVDCFVRQNGQGGITASVQASIERCTALGNTGTGIDGGQGCRIFKCVASNQTGAGSDGIVTGGFGCVVEGCVANSNPRRGISVGSGTTVIGCSAISNAGNGIYAAAGDSLIQNCTAEFSQQMQIFVGDRTSVLDCSVATGAAGGIQVGANCLVRGNNCAGNANGGTGPNISVTGSRNRIEANTCTNATTGIAVTSAGNFITRNTCAGNTTNWNVAAGNVCLVVSSATNTAFAGSSGGTAPGSTDPNANFSY
jgi:hypothetical protein